MRVPPWLKPACWGVVVGALGIMILGFAWGGWVLGSTAERLAKDRADGAVTAVLVPLCVERFMGQAEAAAKLAEFQRSASWQQRPECGGGTGLRPTAREQSHLARATTEAAGLGVGPRLGPQRAGRR